MAEGQGKTLRDVAIGESATVRRLTGEGAVKRHIMDMGITKGTEVFVRKVAPLGDPMPDGQRNGSTLRLSVALHLAALAWAHVQKHASPNPSRQSGAPRKPLLASADQRLCFLGLS